MMKRYILLAILGLCAVAACQAQSPTDELYQDYLDLLEEENSAKQRDASEKLKLQELAKLQRQKGEEHSKAKARLNQARVTLNNLQRQVEDAKRECVQDYCKLERCRLFDLGCHTSNAVCMAQNALKLSAETAEKACNAVLTALQALLEQAKRFFREDADAVEEAYQAYEDINKQFLLEEKAYNTTRDAVFSASRAATAAFDKYLNAKSALTDDLGPEASTCPQLLAMWANGAQYRSMSPDERKAELSGWNVDTSRRFHDRLVDSGYETLQTVLVKGREMRGVQDSDAAELLVNRRHGHCILAFRGEGGGPNDLGASAETTTYRGVQGVSAEVAAEMTPLLAEMARQDTFAAVQQSCTRFTVTGYAMGGGLAQLFALLVRQPNPAIGLEKAVPVDYLYTFASVRVGRGVPRQNPNRADGCYLGGHYYAINQEGQIDWALALPAASMEFLDAMFVGYQKDSTQEVTPCGQQPWPERAIMDTTASAQPDMQSVHWWEVYTQRTAGTCSSTCLANDPCGEHGVCQDTAGAGSITGTYCRCEDGWQGETCAARVAACGPSNPCFAGQGDCVDGRCVCRPGYTGDTCDAVVQDPCKDASPCQNGGTCYFTGDEVGCACPDAWTGAACEVEAEKDICWEASCPEGTLCQSFYTGDQELDFKCIDKVTPTTTNPTTTTATTSTAPCVQCNRMMPTCASGCKNCKIVLQTCRKCAYAVCFDTSTTTTTSPMVADGNMTPPPSSMEPPKTATTTSPMVADGNMTPPPSSRKPPKTATTTTASTDLGKASTLIPGSGQVGQQTGTTTDPTIKSAGMGVAAIAAIGAGVAAVVIALVVAAVVLTRRKPPPSGPASGFGVEESIFTNPTYTAAAMNSLPPQYDSVGPHQLYAEPFAPDTEGAYEEFRPLYDNPNPPSGLYVAPKHDDYMDLAPVGSVDA